MIPRAITREELAALPIRRYEGEVNVVSKPGELERAMEDIRAQRRRLRHRDTARL